MPQTKTLVNITKVTDDSTGMYHVGEIDGLFQEHELREYLKRYGEIGKTELINHLAFLQYQVVDMYKKINAEEYACQCEAKR